MAASQPDRVRRYLLGEMSPQEVAEFEKQYFDDDDLFEELTGAENELVDSFVRGELSEEEQRRFREGYLTSPARRANVEFAGALAAHLARTAKENAPAEGQASPGWKSPQIFRLLRTWPAQLSSALLALALIVTISWAVFANRRLQRQVEQMQAEATESQRRQQDLQEKVTSLTAQLQNRTVPEGEAWQGVPFIQPPGPDRISLTLTPGVERTSGAIKKLVCPPSALLAEFQLYLQHDDYPAYSVSLENAEGRQLWRKDGLKSHAGPDGIRMVEFALPAPHLKTGDYLIKLSGVAANGAMEEAEDYSFSAVRR